MKVIIGWTNEEHSTVEVTSGGLVYSGPDPEHVRAIVERKRQWYDRGGALHRLGDEELVRSLPYRLQGALWAVFVDEATGLTEDQPPYDPWGNVWLTSELEHLEEMGRRGRRAEQKLYRILVEAGQDPKNLLKPYDD